MLFLLKIIYERLDSFCCLEKVPKRKFDYCIFCMVNTTRTAASSSEGIKYSNQEYTRVGYPILGYFRVQVPENLCKTSSSSFKLARKFSSKLGT